MTHTTLFKKESYLVITSTVSIGVLTGQAYFDLALAALLIIPIINLPSRNILSKDNPLTSGIDKCASC